MGKKWKSPVACLLAAVMVFGNSALIVNAEEIEEKDVTTIEQEEVLDNDADTQQTELISETEEVQQDKSVEPMANEETGAGDGTETTKSYCISVPYDDMYFGETQTVDAEVYEENEEGDPTGEPINDVKFEWEISEGTDLISIVPNGSTCDVTAGNKEGDAYLTVIAKLNNEEIASSNLCIYVSDGIRYILSTKDITAHPGDVLSVNDFAPQLQKYQRHTYENDTLLGNVTPEKLMFNWYATDTDFSYDQNTGLITVNPNILNGTNGTYPAGIGITAYLTNNGKLEVVDPGWSEISVHYPNWSNWVTSGNIQTRTCATCGKVESREAYINVPSNSLKMKVKQKTTAFRAAVGAGDAVTSVVSSNKKVLKVSNVNGNGTFKLTALKKGKANLTITTAYGLTKTVKVTVQTKDVKTSKISGLQKKIVLKKGAKQKLSPVITPVTSKQKVTYKSSNKKVVTVSSKGAIKAKKAGKAKITVKSGSKKYTVTVVVKKK